MLVKASVVDLCVATKELGSDNDQDGLIEDREDIINAKLQTGMCHLHIPTILNTTYDMPMLPMLQYLCGEV